MLKLDDWKRLLSKRVADSLVLAAREIGDDVQAVDIAQVLADVLALHALVSEVPQGVAERMLVEGFARSRAALDEIPQASWPRILGAAATATSRFLLACPHCGHGATGSEQRCRECDCPLDRGRFQHA